MTARRLVGLMSLLAVLFAGRDASAAQIKWLLVLDVTTGPLLGHVYTGEVSYDDSGLTGQGLESTHNFAIEFEFPDSDWTPGDPLRTFTWADDPFGPSVWFEDGVFIGMFDFLVCADASDSNADGCDSTPLINIYAEPLPNVGTFVYSNMGEPGTGHAFLLVPEPATLVLLGAGLAIGTWRRRRPRQADAESWRRSIG